MLDVFNNQTQMAATPLVVMDSVNCKAVDIQLMIILSSGLSSFLFVDDS